MRILSAISLAVMTCIWTVLGSAVEIWRETTFGDGGVNTYVSAKGRIQTIYRWDANGEDSYFTERKSSLRKLPKGSWMQYRAVIDTYGVHAPILDTVEIAFE
jgi:hypothetical protein